jgi:hypothetical protein
MMFDLEAVAEQVEFLRKRYGEAPIRLELSGWRSDE